MKAVLTGHTHGLGEALAATLRARGIPVLGLARGRSPQPDDDGFTQIALDLAFDPQVEVLRGCFRPDRADCDHPLDAVVAEEFMRAVIADSAAKIEGRRRALPVPRGRRKLGVAAGP